MGFLDYFKSEPVDEDAPEGDDVDLDESLNDEDVLDDADVVAPDTEPAVQDVEADQSIPDGGEFE